MASAYALPRSAREPRKALHLEAWQRLALRMLVLAALAFAGVATALWLFDGAKPIGAHTMVMTAPTATAPAPR